MKQLYWGGGLVCESKFIRNSIMLLIILLPSMSYGYDNEKYHYYVVMAENREICEKLADLYSRSYYNEMKQKDMPLVRSDSDYDLPFDRLSIWENAFKKEFEENSFSDPVLSNNKFDFRSSSISRLYYDKVFNNGTSRYFYIYNNDSSSKGYFSIIYIFKSEKVPVFVRQTKASSPVIDKEVLDAIVGFYGNSSQIYPSGSSSGQALVPIDGYRLKKWQAGVDISVNDRETIHLPEPPSVSFNTYQISFSYKGLIIFVSRKLHNFAEKDEEDIIFVYRLLDRMEIDDYCYIYHRPDGP